MKSFDFMRDHVERCHAERVEFSRTSRACHECGVVCHLTRGKHSGKWFWTHERDTDCIFDQTGRRIFFETRESAEQTEGMFA